LPIIETVLRTNSQQNSIGKMDHVIEILSHLSKSSNAGIILETMAYEILKTFGTKYVLNQCIIGNEGVLKSSLKLLRTLNENDFGKKEFEAADGSRILSDLLNQILQSDISSASLTSPNSVAALLVGTLRSAVGHSELPYINRFKHRHFPIPEDTPKNDIQINETSSNITKAAELNIDYDMLIDECSKNLLEGEYSIPQNPPQSIEDLVRLKLRRLCPELSYLEGRSVPKLESPNSNISVRHVQPMAPGKHFVCKNTHHNDSETLLRRSPAVFRKVLFEQTARMFQQTQTGILVYDVMDPSVAQAFIEDEKYLFNNIEYSRSIQDSKVEICKWQLKYRNMNMIY
jgi:hypothetical protein